MELFAGILVTLIIIAIPILLIWWLGGFVDKKAIEAVQRNNEGIEITQEQKQKPKKNKAGIAIFVAILIGLYIYLSIPMEVTSSFMGIEIGIKMQYQPLTTCLDYYVTLGDEAHNRVCGVSPVRVFQAKTKMGDLFDYLMQ